MPSLGEVTVGVASPMVALGIRAMNLALPSKMNVVSTRSDIEHVLRRYSRR